MQDKFNILSTKINSTTYMYDVAGGHASWNKLRRTEKRKITIVITVTDKYCGGLTVGKQSKLCMS
eukprot:3615073-Ditylum_brightwellii.AAC.1